MVIEAAGACRTEELCHMVLNELDIRDDIVINIVPNSLSGHNILMLLKNTYLTLEQFLFHTVDVNTLNKILEHNQK